MNTDLAFEITPAKCRLLLALGQYSNFRYIVPKELKEIAKQDFLPRIFESDEAQQIYQFLADIGDRAAIVKSISDKENEDIDLNFMLNAAKYFGHEIVLLSNNTFGSRKLLNRMNLSIPLFDPIAFSKIEFFDEFIKQYENHLILFDMNDANLDNFCLAPFNHFRKIWCFVNWSGFINLMPLKNVLSKKPTISYDPIRSPTIYKGMLAVGGTYFPKIKFSE